MLDVLVVDFEERKIMDCSLRIPTTQSTGGDHAHGVRPGSGLQRILDNMNPLRFRSTFHMEPFFVKVSAIYEHVHRSNVRQLGWGPYHWLYALGMSNMRIEVEIGSWLN